MVKRIKRSKLNNQNSSHKSNTSNKKKSKLSKFFSKLGPGFITGASDDDPSGIATYSQTGAMFGYNQLWTALFSFPFMTAIQEMCGRIGIVTGKGLAGVIKENFSKKILYFCVSLLVIANIINIGADLGAMASATKLIIDIDFGAALLIITMLTVVLQVFVPYHWYAKILKYLTFSLLSYIVVAFIIHLNWSSILISTFIPHIILTKQYFINIVAILGTTISPYLFFWQASEEVEEEVEKKEIRSMGAGIPKFTDQDLKDLKTDTVFGMFFSNLVMFFIIITVAGTVGVAGISHIDTADQAALALKPLAGDFAFLLFAIGIIGTGLLAIPILAGSASYALSETLGLREGLYLKFKRAHGFYGIIAISTILGLLINLISIPPFKMLYYAAIINGICAPPLLFIIMKISNNKKIMGEHSNTKWSNILGWTITAIMSIASVVLLVSLLY